MRVTRAEVVTAGNATMQLGEGLVWDHADRRLSWVDIPAGRVHVASFAEGGLKPERVFEVGAPVGAAYPC